MCVCVLGIFFFGGDCFRSAFFVFFFFVKRPHLDTPGRRHRFSVKKKKGKKRGKK